MLQVSRCLWQRSCARESHAGDSNAQKEAELMIALFGFDHRGHRGIGGAAQKGSTLRPLRVPLGPLWLNWSTTTLILAGMGIGLMMSSSGSLTNARIESSPASVQEQ